jgi:hypothetical protein
MPYAPLALGIETGTSAPAAAGTPPVSDASFDALRRLLALIAGGARPGASVAPQSADVAPQSMLIGGKSTAVVRGPARTGPTLAPVSQLFAGSSAKSTVPTFDEFREAMRNAGILPR